MKSVIHKPCHKHVLVFMVKMPILILYHPSHSGIKSAPLIVTPTIKSLGFCPNAPYIPRGQVKSISLCSASLYVIDVLCLITTSSQTRGPWATSLT